MAGVVGAAFNSATELGAAIGLAIDMSIEASIEVGSDSGGFEEFRGRRAVFWWLLGAVYAEAISVLVFYRTGCATSSGQTEAWEVGNKDARESSRREKQ